MQTLKRFALAAMAVAIVAAPAAAGTKYQTNIVPSDPVHPPNAPTLSPKGQIKISDKGSIQIGLAGVVTAGGPLECVGGANDGDTCTTNLDCPDGACVDTGVPATSSNTLGLDGTEYVAILKLVIPGISGFIPVVEVPLPVELKAGKGKVKLSLSALFGFIPGGIGRTIEFIGTEVWGPLGGQAAACTAIITQPIPASFMSPDPACRGGSQIGISGIAIP